MQHKDRTVYHDPSEVKAVDGKVDVDGPDQVDVTLTPEAAEETSERLLQQSFKARGQTRLKNNAHRPQD
ncbi:hypothetical protein [Sphingomonas sp. URHD0057]|uniref:hypothetical protein n=1 Tax=Sphingomonas sp. URHD0057 TaxID=1380389 RepID=UPI00048DD88D|nr:hypothetical protein [Sphingomonas sp. URHD0057]